MAQTVLTLGQTGLVAGDLSLRFYRDGSLDASGIVAALTVAEIGSSGDYLVTNLPDYVAGTWGTLTWEYPSGVGGWYIYPDQDGPPTNLVLPVRETGLAAVDFDFAIYQEGVDSGDTITATEVGGTGDYRVAGWGSDAGDWLLIWRRYGISYYYGWTVPATAAGLAHVSGFTERLRMSAARLIQHFDAGGDITVYDFEQGALADDLSVTITNRSFATRCTFPTPNLGGIVDGERVQRGLVTVFLNRGDQAITFNPQIDMWVDLLGQQYRIKQVDYLPGAIRMDLAGGAAASGGA